MQNLSAAIGHKATLNTPKRKRTSRQKVEAVTTAARDILENRNYAFYVSIDLIGILWKFVRTYIININIYHFKLMILMLVVISTVYYIQTKITMIIYQHIITKL